MAFPLVRDEEGYPPADSEGLWTIPTENPSEYIVDNIPFFVENIALGDRVDASEQSGLLTFNELIRASGHSTVWAFAEDPSVMTSLRDKLRGFDLRTEADPNRGILAIDVPPQVNYAALIQNLKDGETSGEWEYAEGAVRHLTEDLKASE